MNWNTIKSILFNGLPVIAGMLPGSSTVTGIVKLTGLAIAAIDEEITQEAARLGITREQLLAQLDAGFANLNLNIDNDIAYYEAKLLEAQNKPQ